MCSKRFSVNRSWSKDKTQRKSDVKDKKWAGHWPCRIFTNPSDWFGPTKHAAVDCVGGLPDSGTMMLGAKQSGTSGQRNERTPTFRVKRIGATANTIESAVRQCVGDAVTFDQSNSIRLSAESSCFFRSTRLFSTSAALCKMSVILYSLPCFRFIFESLFPSHSEHTNSLITNTECVDHKCRIFFFYFCLSTN